MAGVETDFLARDPQGLLHVIEVKSAGSIERGIVSERQMLRLERAAGALAETEAVEILILIVSSQGQILPIPV